MAYELKTKKTDASVKAFLDSIENETRRSDGYAVLEMFERLTGETAKMWGAGDHRFWRPKIQISGRPRDGLDDHRFFSA